MTRKLTLFLVCAFEIALILFVVAWAAWAETAKPIPKAKPNSRDSRVIDRTETQQKLENILKDALKAAPLKVEKLENLAERDKLLWDFVSKAQMALGKCWKPSTSTLQKSKTAELQVEIDETGKVISVKNNSDFDSLTPTAYRTIFACLPKALNQNEFKEIYKLTNGVFNFEFKSDEFKYPPRSSHHGGLHQ